MFAASGKHPPAGRKPPAGGEQPAARPPLAKVPSPMPSLTVRPRAGRLDPANLTRPIKQGRGPGSVPYARPEERQDRRGHGSSPDSSRQPPLQVDTNNREGPPLYLDDTRHHEGAAQQPAAPERQQRVPFGGVLPVRSHINVVTRVFDDVPPLDHEELDDLDIGGARDLPSEPSVIVEPEPAPAPVAPAPAPRSPPSPSRRPDPGPRAADGAAGRPNPERAPRPPRPTGRQAAQPRPQPDGPRGQILVFFSCRGGAGATTLAVNVGAIVARTGLSVCVVDLDLQLGEALTFLNIEPTVPLSALARDSENVDWEMLSPRLARHASGLCGLAQTGHLEDLRELDPTRIPVLLDNLRRQFAVVIVDGLRDFNDHSLAALDAADRVILVATQDVPAIRGAARRAAIFRRLGYTPEKFMLVLNRFDRKSPISTSLIGEEAGLAPSFVVANDFPTVSRAINEGLTLEEADGGAEVSKQVGELARRLFSLQAPERPSLWKRLLRRD
jgi:pilus assembly protein CpaE